MNISLSLLFAPENLVSRYYVRMDIGGYSFIVPCFEMI